MQVAVQGEEAAAWRRVHDKRWTLDTLWCYDKSQDIPIISMLSRVESPAFIHVKTKPERKSGGVLASFNPFASSSLGTSAILFELPRFQITFELQPDESVLTCQEHKGYHIATSSASTEAGAGAASLPLTRLLNFLVLHPRQATMPVKLLIPEGSLSKQPCGSVRISTPQLPELHDLELYQYTFQPTTLNFDTAVMQYRLFLAAIFAATHTHVPIPQLGMTGGEHARQLLWQCRVKQPLSQGEAAVLDALAGFSGHTPRLQLLCYSMRRDARSLAFLHETEVAPDDSAESHEAYRQAQWQYLQERRQVGHLPFVNARAELTKEEMQVVFNRKRAHARRGVAHVPSTVDWEQLQEGLRPEGQAEHVAAVEGHLFQAKLLELRAQYCENAAVPSCAAEDLPMEHLMDNPFGRAVAEDHVKSVEAFKASAPPETVARERLPALAKELQNLLSSVSQAEEGTRRFLLSALAFAPEHLNGTALLVLQQAGVMATPASADLLRISLRPGFLQVPLLLAWVPECLHIVSSKNRASTIRA